jgi:hypothetical protein
MEQTDATAATNFSHLDVDRTGDMRRSQINLLSGTIDESNFYINEVNFCCNVEISIKKSVLFSTV